MKTRFVRITVDMVLDFEKPMDRLPDVRAIWAAIEKGMIESPDLLRTGAKNLMPGALIGGRLDFRSREKRKGKVRR